MGYYPTLHRGYRRFGLNERAGDSYGMDPATVYSQSLYMWWRASDLNLSHSQKVTSWQGYTGNVYTSQSAFIFSVAAAQAPVFLTASFGPDMGGVYFNGTITNYMGLSARQNVTPSMVPTTIIWFGRWLPVSGYQSLWGDPSSTSYINYIYNSGSFYSYEGVSSFWYLNTTGSQTRMLALVNYSNFGILYDNGNLVNLYSGNGRLNSQYIQYMSNYSSNPLNAYVGELMVLNIPLTQPQVQDIYNNYYKIKFRNDTTLT